MAQSISQVQHNHQPTISTTNTQTLSATTSANLQTNSAFANAIVYKPVGRTPTPKLDQKAP